MTKWQVFRNTIIHTAAQGIVWVVPVAMLAYPEIGKLSIAAVLSVLVGYLNNRVLSK